MAFIKSMHYDICSGVSRIAQRGKPGGGGGGQGEVKGDKGGKLSYPLRYNGTM